MNELRLFYLLIFLYNTILNNMGGSGCTGKLFFLYFFFFSFCLLSLLFIIAMLFYVHFIFRFTVALLYGTFCKFVFINLLHVTDDFAF